MWICVQDTNEVDLCDYQTDNENNYDQVDCNTLVNPGQGGVGIDRATVTEDGPGQGGAGGANQVSMEQTSSGRLRCDFTGAPPANENDPSPGNNNGGTVNIQNRFIPVENQGPCIGLIYQHCQALFEEGLINPAFANCSEQDFIDAIIFRDINADNCMGLPTEGGAIEQPDICPITPSPTTSFMPSESLMPTQGSPGNGNGPGNGPP